MPALGFLLAWGGYALGSWGYCLVRGYDVSLTEWVNPVHWYAGGWPPPTAPADQLIPTGAVATTKGKTTTTRGQSPPAAPVQAV
jgi:hypothetical protein